MTLLKTLLTIIVFAFFAISFLTFDLASLNLDLPASNMLRENPVAVGVVGGILLLALIGDRRLSTKHAS